MKTPRKHPQAALRYRNKNWYVRWFHDERDYSARIGEVDKQRAQAICILANAALTGLAEWPPELAGQPDVIRFFAKIAEKTGPAPATAIRISDGKSADMIALYLSQRTLARKWHKQVSAFLRRFANYAPTIDKIAPATCMAFVMDYRRQGKLPTSNRAKAALSGFFTWLRKMRHCPADWKPLDGVESVYEKPPEEGILVWEPDETKRLLAAADGEPCGISIWVAIYAGLRRSEVVRLKWAHISDAVIEVRKSKTRRGVRPVPLANALAKRLAREPRISEFVAPWEGDEDARIDKANDLLCDRMPLLLPEIAAAQPDIFGWNPLRHTFASRHVQDGKSIDMVAAWIGDRVDTCRRHYARFTPRGRRDTRIDLSGDDDT